MKGFGIGNVLLWRTPLFGHFFDQKLIKKWPKCWQMRMLRFFWKFGQVFFRSGINVCQREKLIGIFYISFQRPSKTRALETVTRSPNQAKLRPGLSQLCKMADCDWSCWTLYQKSNFRDPGGCRPLGFHWRDVHWGPACLHFPSGSRRSRLYFSKQK